MTTKSIICGEYGTSTNADVPFDIQRNTIWTGVTSQVPHIMWLWDNYTNPSWSTLFKQPAAFVNGEDFTKEGAISKWTFTVNNSNTTVLKTSGFSTAKNYFYGYVYDVLNQDAIGGTQMTIPNIPKGTYRIQYYMPDSARVLVVDSVPLTPLSNTIVLPVFSKGIGIKIQFLTNKLVSNKEIVLNSHKMLSYPNPVTHHLTLEFESSDATKAVAQVYDMYGRLVKNSTVEVSPAQEVRIDLPFKEYQLNAGVYLIQLTNGNKIFTKKIVYE